MATKKRDDEYECFNCGALTRTKVQRISAPHYPRPVCKELACWKAWWRLAQK